MRLIGDTGSKLIDQAGAIGSEATGHVNNQSTKSKSNVTCGKTEQQASGHHLLRPAERTHQQHGRELEGVS